MECLLPFFNVAFYGGDWDALSPLKKQILHSARLYRKGCEAGSFGVEFLCKFAAVEGLVIGGLRERKYATMTERLITLMKGHADPTTHERIGALPQKRHLIAHEARGERVAADASSVPYEVYTPLLDRLADAVFAFATSNLDACQTVSELWARVASYEVPDAILQERPEGFGKYGFRDLLLKRGCIWRDLGATLDKVLATDPRISSSAQ